MALLSGMSMSLGAVYMLVLYRRVMFGAASGLIGALRDLSAAEMATLAPLALITLWMGIHPSSFTRVFDPTVRALAEAQAHAQLGSLAPAAVASAAR